MAFTEMYGFETRDGQQARVDLSQIRSVLPSGSASGYVKVVLDGGNSVTIKGTVDGIYDIIVHYCGKRTESAAPRVRFSGVGTGVEVGALGRAIGGFIDSERTLANLKQELDVSKRPHYTESDVAVREIAQLVGLSCPVSNPREVTEAVNKMQHEHHARIRDLRESTIQWEVSDFRAWMHNLANALGLPDGEDKAAILARAWEVGGTRHP